MKKYLESAETVFILGIKGVGMANLAVILKKMGKKVVGSDMDEQFITYDLLISHDIQIITDFSPEQLPDDVDLFIYSASHQGINSPQAEEAKKRGIPVIPQTQILGELMQSFEKAVAVCGCHGKTTTASLLAYALEKLDVSPSYFIGTSTFQDRWAGRFDKKEYFVAEADEYGVNPPTDKTPKFYLLHPTHILCLNIDFDHPDIYKDMEETSAAFYKFFTMSHAKLYLNIDDPRLQDLSTKLPREGYSTFGFSDLADLQIINPVITEFFSEFELIDKRSSRRLGLFQISLFGMQNISNAAGAILLLLSFGFDKEDIKKAILNFTGAKRRFEKIALENQIALYDDYAHHPAEITSTILSAKARFKDKRVVVIFQPHTYSRTNALKHQFIDSLSHADLAIIAPIFGSARENISDYIISSEDLVEIAQREGFTTISSYHEKSELLAYLRQNLRKGDVLFTIGAGDIYKLKNDIIEVVKSI